MNIYPSFTNVRSFVSYKFSTLRMNALRDSLWARLIGTNRKLAIFPEQTPEKSPNRKFIGVTEISVGLIVGTLDRHDDFDHKFRPYKSYLRDRWVNTYLALEQDGWSPIVVHKIGDNYYVEDGHHRVSVACWLGMALIQAKVWEYPIQIKQSQSCQPVRCAERSSSKIYATRYNSE
jgi:hypothetical protein